MVNLQILPETEVSFQVLDRVVKTQMPAILPKTIRENGVYSAGAEGISGFDPVTVEVDVTSAFEAGKQAEYDRFWDAYQQNGNRKNYAYGFSYEGWNDTTFRPKHNIVPTSALYMFNGSGIVDLLGCLEKGGVVIDFSKCTDFRYMIAAGCSIKHFPVIDMSASAGFQDGFRYAGSLESGSLVNVKPKHTWSNAFANCSGLVDISFSGTIGNSISFAQSGKLSDASIQSIIDALGDLTGAATQTLTFHKEVGARLTVEQKALITAKNWTLVY